MNLHFQDELPNAFSDDSRVWIYQSNRAFTLTETLQLEELLEQFVKTWNSHGAKVKGFANLFFGQFIILMADETGTGVSGCSTDSSVRLIKNIEADFKVDLFNRQMLAFIVHERIQLLPLSKLNNAMSDGIINVDSLFFDNLVQTKEQLSGKWIIPANESWLNKKLLLAKD
ncbi:MAG: hypothetical protein H0W12_12140 [Chitinophagaceae bacterium]|nr:hypothetical protein [Chitinophagaceae bacterium]